MSSLCVDESVSNRRFKYLRNSEQVMNFVDLKTSVFILILISSNVLAVSGEDDIFNTADGEQLLQKRMCLGGFGQVPDSTQQSSPATEATLNDALKNNVCANYNANTMYPMLNLTNMRELNKCRAASEYLMSKDSNIKRPSECQRSFGASCGRDKEGKMVCMIKTESRFLMYDERPLSYCAQNFKPLDSTNPPAPPKN